MQCIVKEKSIVCHNIKYVCHNIKVGLETNIR